MGKKKGNKDLYLASNLAGKRVRKDGRLKMEESEDGDEEMQKKLLRGAGVGEDMMEAIPEEERRAIIKAILESKPQLVQDQEESLSSNENMESRMLASMEADEESHLPDVIDVDQSPSSSSMDTASQMDDTQQPVQDDVTLQEGAEDEDELHSGQDSDTTDNCLTRQDMTQVVMPCQVESTQAYELQEHASVLAAETQYSPPMGTDEPETTIPESPSPASPKCPEQEVIMEHANPRNSLTETCSLKRMYPGVRPAGAFHEFPPRYCPTGLDPDLYTEVIKLKFNILLRRWRSAQQCLKGIPVVWGKPVRTGPHWDGLLRRKVFECDKKDGKGKRGGRYSRRNLQKDNCNTDLVTVDEMEMVTSCGPSGNVCDNVVKESTHPAGGDATHKMVDGITVACIDVDDEGEYGGNVFEDKTTQLEGQEYGRKSVRKKPKTDVCDGYSLPVGEGSTIMRSRERKRKLENISECLSLNKPARHVLVVDDVEKTDDAMMTRGDEEGHVTNNTRTVQFVEEDMTFLKTRNRRSRSHVGDSVSKFVKDDQNVSLCPSGSGLSSSLSPKGDEEKELVRGPDVVDVEDDEKDTSRNSHDVGCWLTSKKGDGRQAAMSSGKKKRLNKRNKIQHDSLEDRDVNEYSLKRKSQKIECDLNRTSKVFVPDLCVLDENSNTSVLSDLAGHTDGVTLSTKQSGHCVKRAGSKARSGTRVVLTEGDIPSSIESGCLLNSQGEMYSTQVASKFKDMVRRRSNPDILGDNDSQTRNVSTFVTVSSGCKKKKFADVDDVVVVGEQPKAESDKSGVVHSIQRRSNRRQSVDIETISEDNSCTLLAGLGQSGVVDEEDNHDQRLNEALKREEAKVNEKSNEKGRVRKKVVNVKRKRTLFDLESYRCEEKADVGVAGWREARKKGNEMGKMDNAGAKTRDVENTLTNDVGTVKRPTTMGHIENQGTCPICDKVFLLTHIEEHASNCGEEISSTREDERLGYSIFDDCGDPGTSGTAPRTTRARSNCGPKKRSLAKEKSPTSSGSDWGELVVEMEYGTK